MTPELAVDARRQRANWPDIDISLGTSPEQAELRYSPEPRSAIRGTL